MSGIDEGDGELTVREPRQGRTQVQWERVLDVGVELLEHGGYDAFTIAALCERAAVAPRALYARVATKDALFLAVYEHGMARVMADHDAFGRARRDRIVVRSEEQDERVADAVRHLVQVFADHAAFLRAIVLLSGAHPEVSRRGERYRASVGEVFALVVAAPGTRTGFCFSVVFAALVVRTAYGPGFGGTDDDTVFGRELVEMAQRYLTPVEGA